MAVAQVNDVELWYEAIGTGVPILMMHGGLGVDHTTLRPWHDPLAQAARVIYYDHRGNGRSARVGPLDHATWHADAAALLDHLGERKAVIFGHSYGGWLAQGFALRYPERVAALVLTGATPSFDYPERIVAAAQARHPEAGAALVAGLSSPAETDEAVGALYRAVLPLYFAGPVRHEVLDSVAWSAAAFTAGFAALVGFDTTPKLGAIDAPVLVINGAHDIVTPPDLARRIADRVPHGRYVELAGSAHFPFIEEPEAYLDAVRGFVAQVAG